MNPKEMRNLKVFGYGLFLILGFIGSRLWIKHGAGFVPFALITMSGFFLLLTVFSLDHVKLVYDRWMKVAHFIGAVVTGFILGAVFYLMFGIIGLVLRLLRKDLLDQPLEPEKNSYWIQREKSELKKECYEKQF